MPNYFLVAQRSQNIGTRIKLENRQNTIGRNNDNDIPLNDPLVSRYHAVIQPDHSGAAQIIDLGSTNGVLVNGLKLEPGVSHLLQHRDVIFIGSNVFNLQIQPDSYQPRSQPIRTADKDATGSLEYRQLFS